jgi:hypothetical protein
VATPSLQQARSHYHRQRRIAAAAALAVRRLFERRRPINEVVATVSAYQFASATASAETIADMAGATSTVTDPAAFAGASAAGFALSEPIIATIDQFVPAPAEALPDLWWLTDEMKMFMQSVETLIASEVADAGRAASQAEFVARPDWQNYVRVLNPPSCKRCAVLAGRIYRDLDHFKRHPNCDCVMVPVQDWEGAHDAGMVSTAREAFDKGYIRDLSKADTKAIEDGADIARVVNAAQGLTTANVFGRRVKATTASTTKRSAWRKANPSILIRLRPDSIYRFAKDRDDAIRLLRLYGYIL